MKIRSGFVSNSSSSSFCLFGVFLGEDKYGEAHELAKDSPLRVECGINEYDDSTYVGLWPEDMNEDETLKEFRGRIRKYLVSKDDSLKDAKISWITDGGYNG